MTGPESTIAELAIPADEFALHQTLSTIEGLSVEIERVVAHNDDHLLPFVWMSDDDHETTEPVLAEDPSVEDIELLADLGDEWFYQMAWVDQTEALVQMLLEEEGVVLAARGTEQRWQFRILFPERAALSRTYDYCEAHEFTLELLNLYRLEDDRCGRFGLTDNQQDTLTLAYEQGYYGIPRDASAGDLATELGISHQALSECVRRGHASLVKNALVLDHDDN